MSLQNNQYAYYSKGILYSYLICLPLLLLYELLILISQPDTDYIVRISVDIWFKTFFDFAGLDAISATLYAAFIIGAIILYQKRSQLKKVKGKYFGLMIAESAVYAILISFLISGFLSLIFTMAPGNSLESLSKLQLFALSLGAGLYEELFFRVILVSLLLYIFNTFFASKTASYTWAAVVAALLFSGIHYVGEFGDYFTLSSFLFRFLFGLALNVIYVTRGFGIAAWTHAIYDVIVVMNL